MCTSVLEKGLQVIATEPDKTASVVGLVADVGLHILQTRIPKFIRYINFLLLTRRTIVERPTEKYSESTSSFRNSTARTTGSAACTSRNETCR